MPNSAEGATALRLGFDISFEDLYDHAGLTRLDSRFLAYLNGRDPALHERLIAGRASPALLDKKQESELLIAVAPQVETFVAELFGITETVGALRQRHLDLTPLYLCKRQFVQRRAATRVKAADAEQFDGDQLAAQLQAHLGAPFDEVAFARVVMKWLDNEAAHTTELDLALRYAGWALHTAAGRRHHGGGLLFHTPRKIDPVHLLHHATNETHDGVTRYRIDPAHLRRREGFALTDEGMDLSGALDQTHYCIWCHSQGKDSCSTGLREKPAADAVHKITFKKSPLGVTLAGCPLEEKISEFHTVKTDGFPIGALAMITLDNPMVAATGHRICNDCMKACIYQKQQPVDIPQAETRTLKDVLELPWGFEIYSLLTRWNPLNLRRPVPRAPSGYKVLVAGMGPAGFGLAHQLLNEGHTVVGIDGLKIEPLQASLSGVQVNGERAPFTPIHDVTALYENLDERVMAGFGGVAEYGITVRWNKNFLKLLRLLLERRSQFSLFGGIRFGGTLSHTDAFDQGFDHIALCMGAGKPTTLDIPNGLARGVRTASDFLMALQLTGAAKVDSIANMQLRLPVVVIGGGLTAIDTATESLAYYVVQVEKFLRRYELLCAAEGEAKVQARWDAEEGQIAAEFIQHARAIRTERAAAAREGRPARVLELLQTWGGVTIAYRRRLIDSPSYTLNHEEVEKALEEGAVFAECLNPAAIEVDELGAVRAIRLQRQRQNEEGKWHGEGEVTLPARTVFVAAGTQPNTVLAREHDGVFAVDGKYFRACDELGAPIKPAYALSKPERAEVLLSRTSDGRFISYFGDLHPSFFGNVVKALGSAKQGAPVLERVLAQRPPVTSDTGFQARLNSQMRALVHEVVRLTPTIVEVVIKAPLAARQFRPGQFFRLQNFETLAPVALGTRMAMEGLALTGAWVDPHNGLVSAIVLEMGGSSDLCASLKPGEPVILMGPTGTPTEIHADETVILVGGGLGNAVLFSIGQAMRAAGCKVLYFAGYKKLIDRYKIQDIEAAADVVVWCSDEAPGFTPTRPQDRAFVGNIVQAMAAYASGALGSAEIAMPAAQRLIAIGSDRMMAAVAQARHDVLRAHLNPRHVAIGSINSPMQCMLKEICAQCLQPHRDPVTGTVSYVFSCFNQDQPLDQVDFPALADRLRQNGVQEKLAAQWIDHCLAHGRPS
ncbi:MAG: pyridine nucleotide-disulfide oxidoreductase [Betaproteobacteria bacterium]|nr:pyridine nucleotide-disulfide oxidoreductase [Betaproteobacteria bacterium]